MYCVIFKSYGQWRISSPFVSLKAAERHRDLYITDHGKDYNTDVSVVYIKEMAPE